MPTLVCPQCKIDRRMRRSRTRGIKERFLRILGIKPYRCTKCGWRGYPASVGKTIVKRVFGFAIVALAAVVVAASAYYIYMDSADSQKEREMQKLLQPKQKQKPNMPLPADLPPEIVDRLMRRE